jgi:hypothetical protein
VNDEFKLNRTGFFPPTQPLLFLVHSTQAVKRSVGTFLLSTPAPFFYIARILAMNTNPSPSGNGLRFSRITSFTVSLCASILVMDAMAADLAALRPAITLQASFDGSADAEFALGDRQIHSAPSMAKPRVGRPGLPSSGVVTLARGEGRFGDALRFHKKVSDMVFFMGEKNMHYLSKNWSGAVSFWLRLSPDEDLEPGYCDPIQITPRDWNDAAFFV